MPPNPKLYLELLEKGSLPASRLRSSLEDLRTPIWSGLLRKRGRGAGEVVEVLKPEVFRSWVLVKYPGAFDPVVDAVPRVANLLMGRDTKQGRKGLDHFVLAIRAHAVPEGLPAEYQVALACIVEATRRFSAASLHLAVPGAGRERPDPTLPHGLRLMTVEGPTNFDRTDGLQEEADVFLFCGTGGRMRDALIDWIVAQEPREVIHFGDFDPVGLQEFGRLHRRMPGRVRFHLPEGLEDLFRSFSNRGLLDAEGNRTILASLERGLHPSADRILEYVHRYGPLEQEAVLVRRRSGAYGGTQLVSKSRFIAGNQCLLRLWNQVHRPDLATPTDLETQARFDAGQEVGRVARGRFPGVLVEADHHHPEEALAESARLMADLSVQAIHEAAVAAEGALVRVDTLVRNGTSWDLVETKSVVEGKDVHVLDASFQWWVATKAGLPIGKAFVMLLNRDYRREGGNLDLEELFRLEDVTQVAQELAPQMERALAVATETIRSPRAPGVSPDRHCVEPYECPFLAHCTRDWPAVEDPVDWLPRVGEKTSLDYRSRGIHRMSDLPENELSDHQLRVLNCHRRDTPWVAEGLGEVLGVIQGPTHYLDFETYASPLPSLESSRPYEAVPVQWSCHTRQLKGEMVHREFLAEGTGNPRETFTRTLLEALGTAGSICVYSHYEQTILEHLAEALPYLADEIRAVIRRLVDLLKIVKANVYLPAFHGSYSIKKILPALAPGFGYAHLQVQDGLQAMQSFRRMLEEPEPAARGALRGDLLAYCAQDTLAMVQVHDALRALAGI